MRSATKVTVLTLAILMGLAGIEHGIGEMLQGSVAPRELMFPSWPDSAFFRIVGGEPALTVIPNLLITGILAILFSLAFMVWAAVFAERKNGPLVMLLLSAGMLLLGGGIFPPTIGILASLLAARIRTPFTRWLTPLSAALRHFLSKAWPWVFGVCITSWLLLFPGINILCYFFGLNDPRFTVALILFAFGALLVTVFAGFVQDSERQRAI